MPRRIPAGRFDDLVRRATEVFIARGWRRTQMADIAVAVGVSKPTLYLYVESKEALFWAVLRYADRQAPPVSGLDLPLRAPGRSELRRSLRARLAEEAIPPALEHALERRRVPDARAEFEGILRELFALSFRHRTSIKLFDRCGRDHPELAATFYGKGRFAQLNALVRYLDARIRAKKLPTVPDVPVAARFVIEVIATWAVHLHWDPAPQPLDPQIAEETVIQLVMQGLMGSAN